MNNVSPTGCEMDERLTSALALLDDFPVYLGCISLGDILMLICSGYAEIMFLDRVGLTPEGRQKLYELRGP